MPDTECADDMNKFILLRACILRGMFVFNISAHVPRSSYYLFEPKTSTSLSIAARQLPIGVVVCRIYYFSFDGNTRESFVCADDALTRRPVD